MQLSPERTKSDVVSLAHHKKQIMFGQILGLNSNNLLHCRACLCNNGTFLSIYDENLAQIFHELTSIQVSENDFLPKELCSICAERLKDFRNFKELCLGSHRTLTAPVVEVPPESEVGATAIVISSNDSDSTVSSDHNESYVNEIKTAVLLPQSTKDETHPEIIKSESINNNHEEIDKNFFYCSHCTKKFRSKLILCKHLKNTHFKEETLDQSRTERQCPHETCNRSFYKQETLEAHMRSHLTAHSEQCPHCPKTFADLRCLKQHLRTHSPIKNFSCRFCEKSFRASNILAIHENAVHTKRDTFVCDICGDTFYSRNNLFIHKINRHSDFRRFKCDECPKAFKFRNQLKEHLIRHRKIKNVFCPDCTATFVMEKDLKIHQRLIHHRNYRFECQECGRKYQVKSQLEIHMRVHTGERPFLCGYCGKGFQKNGTLKKHTYTHTGERPHKCKECPKAYTELFILKRHVKQRHSSEITQ